MDAEATELLGERETTPMSDPALNSRLSVRYRFKNAEFEATGAPEEVNRHVMAFFSYLSRGRTQQKELVSPYQQPLFAENETPLPASNGASTTAESDRDEVHGDEHLLSFYLEITFDSKRNTYDAKQSEQLLLITYHKEQYEHCSPVTLADYRKGYVVLGCIPVKEPRNISARLAELVEAEHLRKVGDGYSLTIMGKQFVEKMIKGE